MSHAPKGTEVGELVVPGVRGRTLIFNGKTFSALLACATGLLGYFLGDIRQQDRQDAQLVSLRADYAELKGEVKALRDQDQKNIEFQVHMQDFEKEIRDNTLTVLNGQRQTLHNLEKHDKKFP